MVDADLGDADPGDEPEEPRLFDRAGVADLPGGAAFDAQLLALHMRLYASAPASDRLAADRELFTAALTAARADPDTSGEPSDVSRHVRSAWKTLLAGMLRDPQFWTY